MRCTVTARPTFADGVLTPHAKTARSRRRVTLKGRALVAYKAAAARLDTPIVFPAPQGGYLSIDNFRDRDWYPVLEAAAIDKRGPYQLGPTFATEALASGLSKTVTPTARAFEANIVALAPGVMAGATALAAGGCRPPPYHVALVANAGNRWQRIGPFQAGFRALHASIVC